MGAVHDHAGGEIRHEKPLWWALGLTTLFLIAEVVGGLLTNSLALLSDAAHMATDVIALTIALVAVRLSRRPPDAKRTYGYVRMEALGAMVNGGMLFLVAGYIMFEAVKRFGEPPSVGSTGMLIVASLGLVINLISMRLLKAGSGESLNVKGAYLEVWADMLGSVGVIFGALIIMATGFHIVDPIIAVLMGLWVLPRTWILLREAGNVVMESAPKGIDTEEVRAAMLAQSGVAELHELHVWALSSAKSSLTAHVVVEDPTLDVDALRMRLARMLEERFDLHHLTLQIEGISCRTGDSPSEHR